MRARLADSFAALREPQFRRLFLAHAISVFGDMLVPVALAFAVLDLTGSASDLGVVLTARLVPMVVFMLVGGVWADRLPRQQLMIASNLVRFVSQGVLGTLLLSGHARIWQLVALQIVGGAATAFFRPASSGIVPQTVSAERLQQANGLMWGAFGVGGFVGPAVAGLVLAVSSAGTALLADAATFLVAALLLTRLELPALPPREREPFLAELRAGAREVTGRTWLWASIVSFSIFQVTILPVIMVLGPVVAKQSLGGSSAWAAIAAGFGVGSIAGNFVALHVRPRRPLVFMYGCVFVCGLTVLGLAVPIATPLLVATEALAGAAIGISGVVWETTVQEHVPRESLSRVSAWDWMGSMVLRPLGVAAAGPLASAVGVRATLVGAALLMFASNAVALSLGDVRRVTRRGAPPEEPLHAPPMLDAAAEVD